MFIIAIRYPSIELALTAQTKQNAAELLKDKTIEILKHYPLLNNEIIDKKFSKDDGEILFVNGSRIDILANSQSSKGQRRKRINIEEAALLDNTTFEDALKPIVEVSRYTVGKLGIVNPEELNQQINFFTTSGFRGSTEFARSLAMVDSMMNLKGEIVLGSDWKLGCWYGRGSTKSQILKKKAEESPIAFAQNYESKWCGAVDNALVDINKLLNLRTLSTPETKPAKNSEYYVAMDVARSQSSGNNQSSIMVLKVLRNKENRIRKIKLVNIIYVPNFLNFTAQAIELKRTKYLYGAKIAIIDENGLGAGLKDELLKEQIDPITGELYPCWDTINTTDKPDIEIGADKCLYALHSQGINTEIIVNFIDMVEGSKLELLVKHSNSYDLTDKEYMNNILVPMMQTDFLIEEIANLQLQHLPSGKLSVKQVTKRVDKDRYSALAYGLYYIMKFENTIKEKTKKIDINKLFLYKQPSLRS